MKPPAKPLKTKPRQVLSEPRKRREEHEDYELSQFEAITLNCLEEESSEAGHAVQLQLTAHAALGKAKRPR